MPPIRPQPLNDVFAQAAAQAKQKLPKLTDNQTVRRRGFVVTSTLVLLLLDSQFCFLYCRFSLLGMGRFVLWTCNCCRLLGCTESLWNSWVAGPLTETSSMRKPRSSDPNLIRNAAASRKRRFGCLGYVILILEACRFIGHFAFFRSLFDTIGST